MSFEKIHIPAEGSAITVNADLSINVPKNPIPIATSICLFPTILRIFLIEFFNISLPSLIFDKIQLKKPK